MLSKVKRRVEKMLSGIAGRLPPFPNLYTILALCISLLSLPTVLLVKKPFVYLLLFMIFAISSMLDMIDGIIARVHGKVTKLGAFLDSVCDRIVDFMLMFSLLYLIQEVHCRLLIVLLMFFSLMVSYTRARAESLGLCLAGVGLMERAERLITLLVLLIVLYVYPALESTFYLKLYLLILTVLTLCTLAHRVIIVCRKLRELKV